MIKYKQQQKKEKIILNIRITYKNIERKKCKTLSYKHFIFTKRKKV